MTWVFYIADPADVTYATPLVDFVEDPTATDGFGVRDGVVDLGMPDPSSTFLHQPPASGGILATTFYPEVEMSFSLFVADADYDTLLARVLLLNEALSQGGTIVWQPDGATDVRYIDFYPSPLTQMFHGQAISMQKVTQQLIEDELPIRIQRFPWMRGPEVQVAAAVAVENTELQGHLRITNPGNVQSPMKVTIDPFSANSRLIQVRMGRKSQGDLTDFESSYQFDPTVEETVLPKRWKRLWKKVVVPSTPEGLIGNYRVLGATQLLTSARYRLQLRWGNVSTDPMGASNRYIDFDNTDYDAWDDFADISYGKARYDPDGSSLTLEMWGVAPDDDSPEVDFGTFTLMPADEQAANLTVPGFRSRRFGREDIWGDMWDITGTGAQVLNDDTVRLYQNGASVEYIMGVLPEGQHVVAFRGHIGRGRPTSDDPSDDVRRTGGTVGNMKVYEAGSPLKNVNLRYLKGHPLTAWEHDNPKRILFFADGSSSYKVEVNFTDTTGNGRRIHVSKVVHWFIPFCDNDRQMVMDSYERTTYLADAGGARWLPLHNHGALMQAAPGENTYVMRFGYASFEGSFHDADDRGPLSKARPGYGANITIDLTPYYTS